MQVELLNNEQGKPIVSFEHSNVNESSAPSAAKYNWYNSSLSVQKIPSIQLWYSIVLLQCKSMQIWQNPLTYCYFSQTALLQLQHGVKSKCILLMLFLVEGKYARFWPATEQQVSLYLGKMMKEVDSKSILQNVPSLGLNCRSNQKWPKLPMV